MAARRRSTRSSFQPARNARVIANRAARPAPQKSWEQTASVYFVPELLLAGRAMKSAMELLRPLMVASSEKLSAKVVIGTVKGDLHDIGKNIVASMLEGSGFEVVDLGTDVAPEKFVASVTDQKPQIVCISALPTVTMPAMKTTIDALKTAGVRTQVKVLIGGAPVTMQYANEIGADGYSENASGTVGLVRSLLSEIK